MFRGTLWGGLLGVITSAIQGVVKDAAERAGEMRERWVFFDGAIISTDS